MKKITCGICGTENRLRGNTIEDKLTDFTRKSNRIYKCKSCRSFLTIVRVKNEWASRWIEVATVDVTDLISEK